MILGWNESYRKESLAGNKIFKIVRFARAFVRVCLFLIVSLVLHERVLSDMPRLYSSSFTIGNIET